MLYRSKKEKDQAILQYVGDCLMQGMSKSEAVRAAQDKFFIGSPATVYLCIRRARERRQLMLQEDRNG